MDKLGRLQNVRGIKFPANNGDIELKSQDKSASRLEESRLSSQSNFFSDENLTKAQVNQIKNDPLFRVNNSDILKKAISGHRKGE